MEAEIDAISWKSKRGRGCSGCVACAHFWPLLIFTDKYPLVIQREGVSTRDMWTRD